MFRENHFHAHAKHFRHNFQYPVSNPGLLNMKSVARTFQTWEHSPNQEAGKRQNLI